METIIDKDSDEFKYLEKKDGILSAKSSFLFFTYRRVPFNGTIVKYYENGQLRVKGTMKDGEQHGIWEQYSEDGQLQHKRTYKDGELDGISEKYYENGQLQNKRTYKDGKQIE